MDGNEENARNVEAVKFVSMDEDEANARNVLGPKSRLMLHDRLVTLSPSVAWG